MKYWINTVSKDHVLKGIEGGFTQADHGKNTRLKQISKDDYIIFYSPKTKLNGGEKLQSFTAICKITDSIPYRVEMTPDFHPWRRNAEFFKCSEIQIKQMLDELSFIKDKKHWGFPFRRGLFSISKNDFDVISKAMKMNEIS